MMTVKGGVKEIVISARVIRADGTIENLGVISRTKPKNIFERIIENMKRKAKGDK